MNREEYQGARRWALTAATWAEGATVRLEDAHGRTDGERRWAIGYHAERLLHALLLNAGRLAPLIPDDLVEDALEQARGVADQLNRRRLAAKLEQVAGRTGPEADAYREKAARLRDGQDG